MKMTTTDKINKILNIKDSYQAPQKIMDILYSDKEERDKVFMEFLETFDKKVTEDWFRDYFQEEHSARKKHKQDFTPHAITKLVNQIVGSNTGNYYEIAGGTGGILIERWQQDRLEHTPFDYEPSMYFYTLEEISDRAIPFLLFNMIIRGMNGVVVQCDTLTREASGVFFIQNDANNPLGFSSLNRMDYNENIEKEFDIKFTDKKYPEIKQTEDVPSWLIKDMGVTE